MNKKMIFAAAAILLIATTTLTFAHSTATAAVNITATGSPSSVQSVGGSGDAAVPNTVQLKYSTGNSAPYVHVAPSWSPVKNTAGTIIPGDVYYVDTSSYTGDIRVTVYLTNAGSLAQDYSYLNMQVNVWAGSSGTWTQATTVDDNANATEYLTLENGTASFILEGNTHYCFSIDGGSFYCINTTADSTHSLSPQYYIDVKSF